MPTPEQRLEIPTEQMLLGHVRGALADVSDLSYDALTADSIASAIAKRVGEHHNIDCYSGKRVYPEGCAGSEWLFDFGALLYEEPSGVRLVAQPAVIGEIEWDHRDSETDWDFEKLLIVDSIVCFFICGVRSQEEANKKLDRYENAVNVRRKYAALRGTRPPSFLLACYIRPDDRTTGSVVVRTREIPARSSAS